MKLILFLLFLLPFSIFSKEYTFESRGYSKQQTINFKNKSKFIHITTFGWWTDSKGNYGKETCYGRTEIIDGNIKLDIVCELVDQENQLMKTSRKRSSIVGGGIGINRYLETSEKYKDLLDKKCTYAVTFLRTDFFYKQKCKME